MLKEQKVKIVNEAIEIIEDPNSWVTGPLAAYKEYTVVKKDNKNITIVNNIPVDPSSSKATCWCAIGAIVKVSPNDHTVRDELREFCKKQYRITLADMNDIYGRKNVIDVLNQYMKSL